MKRLPELRRTPGLSLEIQNISPRYLPVQEYVLPWLRPWLTADPHDKAVFIAKVTFRAKADHFDTSPGVKVGAIVAKDGEKIRLALREASRQIRVYPAAGAPASISGVLYFVGTLPLDLTAGGYSHVMELAATVRFDGRTIAVRRSSETETSTIAGGLFARRNSWEWWEYARESRVLNCACPLDGNLCLELLNASEDVRGLEVRRTRIAASGASPGLGLLFHQASFTESTEPASPPWDLAGRSFKRLRFSASSQEVRVARALPLIGFYDPVTATWRPWAVPLIDPSWSVAEQDLRAFCIYPNAEPISIASSSRPIAAPIRLFGDSLFGPPGAVLRIKNELPGPVRLLSVQEAHIVESDHPPGVIQGFGQRSGSARLTPNFVYGEEAPTLAAGEEMDFSLSMTFAALEQGTFATFVMVTANVDDVPGAASILVPVVYTNYLVP
ncbi:MAG: hypothetical protein HZC37_18305 [Burkholderiales bacterium]|nr:hypothetical protein [Burkholderiales bacterium]